MKFKDEIELFARTLIDQGMELINYGNSKEKREGFTKINIGRQLKTIIKENDEKRVTK